MTVSKNRTSSSATHLTRRMMIQSLAAASAIPATAVALGASGAAVAAPVESGGDDVHPDARLIRLMTEWRYTQDTLNASDWDCASNHPLFQRLQAIEWEAASITPQTVKAFAIKLLLLTAYGDFGFDGAAAGLYAEAECLSGFPRALIGADAAIAPTASAPDVSRELIELIDTHKHAWDAYGDTIDASDVNSKAHAGEEGENRTRVASEYEEACLAAIVAFPSRGPVDDRAKGAYLRDMPAEFGGYEEAIIHHLLNA